MKPKNKQKAQGLKTFTGQKLEKILLQHLDVPKKRIQIKTYTK